jgi:hypothetical protein
MSFPHRNDVSRFIAPSPNDNHNLAGEPPDRDETLFTIIKPVILPRKMPSLEEGSGIREIQSSFQQSRVALGGIIGNGRHNLM